MKVISIIILFISVLFIRCENDEMVDTDISFDELLVVQCEINPGLIFPGVRLTKTLPVGTSFSIEKAEVKDASMYLRIDYLQIIPLHYFSEGNYKTLYDFTVQEGQVFELFGESNGVTFYSRTIIPYKPAVNSVSYNNTDHYPIANIRVSDGEVYGALWAIISSSVVTGDDFYNIVNTSNNPGILNTEVRGSSYPENYLTANYNGSRYIQVFSFDKSFEPYFKTFKHGETINNPYVQGTGTTLWNVTGDNVIGMFIGVARGDFIWVN